MQKDGKIILICIVLLWICYFLIATVHSRYYPWREDIITKPVVESMSQSYKDGKNLLKNNTKHEELIQTIQTRSGVDEKTTRKLHRRPNLDSTYLREDTKPEKTGNLPFLENFKNPCWRELTDAKNESRVRCLPYFYLAAFPKCGTTDFYNRVTKHPQISSEVPKQKHWFTRRRFREAPKKNLSSYLQYFDGAVEKEISKRIENSYHPMIFGDCSPSLLWDNRALLRYEGSSITIPPFTNADIVHHLTPQAKILILIRNPITRLYSEYLFFAKNKSVQNFHEEVIASIKEHNECLQKYSQRYCAYFLDAPVRIQLGFYHLFIEDFLRVFPRKQMKVIKLEDLSQHMPDSYSSIFTFLDVDTPSNETMHQIQEVTRSNVRKRTDKSLGDMLPTTWQLLIEFYEPYNQILVKLLGGKFRY